MTYAFCPDCDARIDLGDEPQEGQLVTCPQCDSELELLSLNPPELDWAYTVDDDWEWDWDEEGDYDDWEDEELEAM